MGSCEGVIVLTPKVVMDIGPFQVFTFSNENGEPMHVHVSRGANHSVSLKFWFRNDDWVLDRQQSSLRVTPREYKAIPRYIRSNTADILHELHRVHSPSTGNVNRMELF